MSPPSPCCGRRSASRWCRPSITSTDSSGRPTTARSCRAKNAGRERDHRNRRRGSRQLLVRLPRLPGRQGRRHGARGAPAHRAAGRGAGCRPVAGRHDELPVRLAGLHARRRVRAARRLAPRRPPVVRARRVRYRGDRDRASPHEHRPPARRPRAEAGTTTHLAVSVAIIGGGSWGTALAIHAARSGAAVRLWAREPEVVDGIRTRRRSPWYLADLDVPATVEPTTDAGEALHGATMVIIVVPSEVVAATLETLPPIPEDVPIVSATKGLDPERHLRMSEVIVEAFPAARVAVLSGPTFARAVALGRPTAAVIASRDDTLAALLQRRLGARGFRLYANRDVVGVETGGALKNVMAIP